MTNTDMHFSGLVLQVVFLERYLLESEQFSFWSFQFPFQFSISTVFKSPVRMYHLLQQRGSFDKLYKP